MSQRTGDGSSNFACGGRFTSAPPCHPGRADRLKRVAKRSAQCMLLAGAISVTLAQLPGLPRASAAHGAGDNGKNAGRTIILPHRLGNAMGGEWMLVQGGLIQQQSGVPIYSQASAVTIDGNQPSPNSNQARLESDGEIVVDGLQVQNLTISRRILFDGKQGYWRIIDVLKNTQAQDVSVQYGLSHQVNYGIRSSNSLSVPGPKGGDMEIGANVSDGQGRSLSSIFCGRGGKVAAAINADQNSNIITALMNVTIPAHKEIAIMHFVMGGSDLSKLEKDLSGPKAMANIPWQIRRELVNFGSGQGFGEDVYGSALEDIELLRGDLFDVVELRDGDQYKGTLTLANYKLDASYGAIDLPAAQVLGILNLGQARPRQFIVTRDGQIFGGRLQADSLPLMLSGGQATQVPLNQVKRVGYRTHENDETHEFSYTKPMLFLRAGDRLAVSLPDAEIPVATRYGMLQLKPQLLAALILATPEQPVHEIILSDGSRFAGVITSSALDVNLLGAGGAAPATQSSGASTGTANPAPGSAVVPMTVSNARFPWSQIARLQLDAKAEEPDYSAPTLRLSNGDSLVGTLQGTLKLDTPFDTLNLEGQQIKSLTPVAGSAADVTIRLWDDTSLSGAMEASELDFKMSCGLEIKAPLSLLAEYNQPYPQPSQQILQRVKDIVAKLNDPDWKERDQAQAELVQMGPVVTPVLRQLRASQPDEGKQRIDNVISSFKPGPTIMPPAQGAPAPQLPQENNQMGAPAGRG